MDKPLWMWLLFIGIILILLVIDLGIFNKKDHEIGVKESLLLSAFYIAISLLFGLWVWYKAGAQSGEEYFAGYLIEKSLSIDNIFVISMIFTQLQIPRMYQHRVIFWGVLGVIVLRGIMIGLGATLVANYSWILYLFAIFLIFTGIKILVMADNKINVYETKLFKFIKKHFRVTDQLYGNKFIVSIVDPKTGKKQLWMTPLLMTLLLIESIDLMFAIDSIPAIFAITTDTYIIYTSNIFAILGLRALYFALSAVLNNFEFLKHAIALVLVFIGAKIFIADFMGLEKFPTTISLMVVMTLITLGIAASLYKVYKDIKFIDTLMALHDDQHKTIMNNKIYQWFAAKSHHKNYLELNEHSVANAVAVGLIAALVPLPMQMLIAIFLAFLFKGNIIVAALCTWITNPFTFVPLNLFIYKVGSLVTHDPTEYITVAVFDWHGKNVIQICQLFIEWIQALGKPFLIGLPIVAFAAGLIGYILTRIIWKYAVKR